MNNGIKITRVGEHRAPFESYREYGGLSAHRIQVQYILGCDNCGKSLHIADNIGFASDFTSKILRTRMDFSRVFCDSDDQWKWQADGQL